MCNTVSTSCSWGVSIAKWSIGYFLRWSIGQKWLRTTALYQPNLVQHSIPFIQNPDSTATYAGGAFNFLCICAWTGIVSNNSIKHSIMRKSLEVIVEACMVQERVDLDRQRTASHHLHYFLVCLRCTNQFFEHNWKELAHFVVFAPVPARGNKKSIVFVAICFCFHVVMNADPSPIITARNVQKLNQIL